MRLLLGSLVILTCSLSVVAWAADVGNYKNQLPEAAEALRRSGEVCAKINFAHWKAPRSDFDRDRIDWDRKRVENLISVSEHTRGIIARMLSSARPSTVDLFEVSESLIFVGFGVGGLSDDAMRFDPHSEVIKELGAAAAATLQASSGMKRIVSAALTELESQAGTCSPTPTPCTKENAPEPTKQLMFTYECRDTLSGEKIPVLITVADETPVEIASGLRQKIRAIPDVEVVYTKNDAALEVGVLGYENLTIGGVRTGYSVSMITTSTCKSSVLGATATNVPVQFDITLLDGHRLLTAATAREIVEQAVASFDNEDLEGQRRVRSMLKKAAANH